MLQVKEKDMDTLMIELTNHKAYKLLQDMEDLNLIRVLKKNQMGFHPYAKRLEPVWVKSKFNNNWIQSGKNGREIPDRYVGGD